MGIKAISFSLWGKSPKYCRGAVENAKLARLIYPDWKCRFYVNASVDKPLIDEITGHGAEVKLRESAAGDWNGLFWRFLINDDPEVDVFLSRDCDSRLNDRERVAVEEWLDSGYGFHAMCDHPLHIYFPIMGGMWGARVGTIVDIASKMEAWTQCPAYYVDQNFLRDIIWPGVKNNCWRHVGYCHDKGKYGESHPFPKHPPLAFGGSFVGEVFDENNRPRPDHAKQIADFR